MTAAGFSWPDALPAVINSVKATKKNCYVQGGAEKS